MIWRRHDLDLVAAARTGPGISELWRCRICGTDRATYRPPAGPAEHRYHHPDSDPWGKPGPDAPALDRAALALDLARSRAATVPTLTADQAALFDPWW